jgi:uncharacterized repeat protein (TIGR03803 family)
MKTKRTLLQNGDQTMKTCIKSLFLLPALVAGLALIPAGRVMAQFNFNSDGANPNAGLILSGNTLYGTAADGGGWDAGTVFAVNTDGSGFWILHSFTGGSDGANPWAGMILSGNTLYGTTYSGGSSGKGTVFAVNTDGTGFTNLHHFTGGIDGAGPIGGLILSGNTLYGTTKVGGTSGNGTAFSLSLPPPRLTITASGPNLVLSWPTNHGTGFIVELESTVDLSLGAAGWVSVPLQQPPIILNGQFVVTIPAPTTYSHIYYRLKLGAL